MVAHNSLLAARGLTDGEDRLLSADQPLAELHQRCGGNIPGKLAIPELLELVQQGRRTGLRIAREFTALDGDTRVTGFARVHPLDEAESAGCELLIENWRRESIAPEDDREIALRQDAVDRATAEFTARLDGNQRLLAGEGCAADLGQLIDETRKQSGKAWVEYVELVGISHRQPLHWRLLDGVKCRVAGSSRDWRARLIPVGTDQVLPRGFELLLVAEQPLLEQSADSSEGSDHSNAIIGEALTPSLRQPVARIIANAETIRTRMAGPLREEYSNYAEDIVAAGQHLSGLLDDLNELEVVEAPGFGTARQKIDLAELARQACGMLTPRANIKQIELDAPDPDLTCPAIGEGRRVLQVLLNIIGNAINYSPDESKVSVSTGDLDGGSVSMTVCDEGPGLKPDELNRVFAKFERLGRSGDGGSGLGLYISRKLALAMGGDLSVISQPGKGACFTLTLPADAG
ncbi:MAG: HAMP domain-containing histidine kinase [Sphingomonadales bacterium]|nr:MAG: HAMP domain-containing histidine kinase [Sphingomonadales bacterium]